MTRVDPNAGTAKWVQRLSAATQDISNGIDRVTVAPGSLAAAASPKWLASVQAAEPKFKANVGAVTLESWKNSAKTIGVPRIADGAQKKQGKYLSFAQEFYPFLDAGVAKVKAMDSTTFEARVQRAVAMMRYNRSFKRSGSR